MIYDCVNLRITMIYKLKNIIYIKFNSVLSSPLIIVHFDFGTSFKKCKGMWVEKLTECGSHFYLLFYSNKI